MVDTYSVSTSWLKLKQIHVPTVEENLRQDLTDTLYTFKRQRLAQMVSSLTDQLRGADEERQRQLLTEIKYYSDLSRKLGTALGQVIAPRFN